MRSTLWRPLRAWPGWMGSSTPPSPRRGERERSYRSPPTRPTSTPSLPRLSRRTRVISRSKRGFVTLCAGTTWPWSSEPTRCPRSFGEWNEVFPNATCVVALVDRPVHRSEILSIAGDSYRLKEAQERAAQRAARRAPPRRHLVKAELPTILKPRATARIARFYAAAKQGVLIPFPASEFPNLALTAVPLVNGVVIPRRPPRHQGYGVMAMKVISPLLGP
ncbi:MAG: ATP-binding protein [Steroidobacteraceae bacterium]